jgi:predicted aspartyl protease
MGRVCENLTIVGLRGSTEVKALFDTEASRTFLHGDVAKKIGYTRFPEPREVSTAIKGKKLIIVGMAFFETEINGCKVPWSPAYVSPELVEEMVVGIDLMGAHNIRIDPKKGKVDVSGFIGLTILPFQVH